MTDQKNNTDKDKKEVDITLPKAVSRVADAICWLALAVVLSGLLQCNGALVGG